ncbi:MAG TPA: LPS export ABC transporter permease LptG [Candidatus Angelobacter sp.]|nr:LPS export ABC transporter permease LptG [Candidatus Angelobacter sp.]
MMMSTAGNYASRSLLGHLAMTLSGFVAFLLLLDLMNRGDEVVQRHGKSVLALGKYAALRVPDLASFILPFAVLIASLLMLAKFARNNEIMALKASGLSFYHLLLSLAPAALLVGLLHFLVSDQVVPRTARILQQWDAVAQPAAPAGKGAADTSAAGSSDNLTLTAPSPGASQSGAWIRDGDSYVKIETVLADGKELHGVTIFERQGHATLSERVAAERALFDGTNWRLLDVRKLSLAEGQDHKPERIAEMPWVTSLVPDHLADLTIDPATLSMAEVWRFVSHPEVGSRPVDFYKTWLLRKIALPLVTIMMVLLAAPVAQGLQRHGGLGAGLAVGVGLGFLYFVTDGLLMTLGEMGTIPPLIAAWSPTALFMAIGVSALLKIEGY